MICIMSVISHFQDVARLFLDFSNAPLCRHHSKYPDGRNCLHLFHILLMREESERYVRSKQDNLFLMTTSPNLIEICLIPVIPLLTQKFQTCWYAWKHQCNAVYLLHFLKHDWLKEIWKKICPWVNAKSLAKV